MPTTNPSTLHPNPSAAALPYNSELSLWLSVDPLSDKYPNLSPYVYCANNPVRLVDVDGRTWEIDGIPYTPGTTCPDNCTESTREKWLTMDRIYATRNGKMVIDEMSAASDVFNIISAIDPNNSGDYMVNENTSGGTIRLFESDCNIITLSHEIFHGYQDLYGQTGSSIVNEIEANLFAYSIAKECGASTVQCNIMSKKGTNTADNCWELFNNNAKVLYRSTTFDKQAEDAFYYVRDEFQSSSNKNYKGTYQNYPLERIGQEVRLISKFYPLDPSKYNP